MKYLVYTVEYKYMDPETYDIKHLFYVRGQREDGKWIIVAKGFGSDKDAISKMRELNDTGVPMYRDYYMGMGIRIN